MEKQFVTYEIALKLKELDFDEPCLAYYDMEILFPIEQPLPDEFNTTKTNNIHYDNDFHYPLIKLEDDIIIAPLYQQVVDWFREKHNLHISVLPFKLNDKYDDVKLCWYYVVIDINRDGNITLNADSLNPSIENFNSYEEAREQAILKAIELCQK